MGKIGVKLGRYFNKLKMFENVSASPSYRYSIEERLHFSRAYCREIIQILRQMKNPVMCLLGKI